MTESILINIKILKYYTIPFIDISINTIIYVINVAEPTIIKYSKCYIYKPHLNFIKNSPLKKLLKLCRLCQSKARFPYILFYFCLLF